MPLASSAIRLAYLAAKLDGRQADGIIHMDPKSARFVADVVERWSKQQFIFSDAQRQWIEDLEERYL